ncbi:MAG: hypothetical protein PF541_07970 [Prolixibacteraceae bacterium]|jgi:endonuclease/exonuclease/phosphatase family metal-dependent hydrolase|nr:hypothetical protein [Prolixibacteraceae bacterium]
MDLDDYTLENGKNFLIINTLNSACNDGSLRLQQMGYLKSILIDLYKNGNYVIVGGDWNQCPNEFVPKFNGDVFDEEMLFYIEANYPEHGWTWAYDQNIPSNRRVLIPYEKGKTLVAVIDLFLLSHNIDVEKVNGCDLGFEFSDHQPVELKIKRIN